MDDAAGFVGFDVVAVDDPLEGCASVDDVAVGVGRDVAESKVAVDAYYASRHSKIRTLLPRCQIRAQS